MCTRSLALGECGELEQTKEKREHTSLARRVIYTLSRCVKWALMMEYNANKAGRNRIWTRFAWPVHPHSFSPRLLVRTRAVKTKLPRTAYSIIENLPMIVIFVAFLSVLGMAIKNVKFSQLAKCFLNNWWILRRKCLLFFFIPNWKYKVLVTNFSNGYMSV